MPEEEPCVILPATHGAGESSGGLLVGELGHGDAGAVEAAADFAHVDDEDGFGVGAFGDAEVDRAAGGAVLIVQGSRLVNSKSECASDTGAASRFEPVFDADE